MNGMLLQRLVSWQFLRDIFVLAYTMYCVLVVVSLHIESTDSKILYQYTYYVNPHYTPGRGKIVPRN